MAYVVNTSFVPDLDDWVAEVVVDDKYDAMILRENGKVYLLSYDDQGVVSKFDYYEFEKGIGQAIAKLEAIASETDQLRFLMSALGAKADIQF